MSTSELHCSGGIIHWDRTHDNLQIVRLFPSRFQSLYFGDRQTDGLIVFSHEETPVLGSEYTVTIALAHPEYLGDALQKDATFDCREGPKIIGRGKVLNVEATKS